VGQHRSVSASRLLGLDGLMVLAAQVAGGEWHLNVETTTTVVDCMGCGVRASFMAGARSGCVTCPVAAVRWRSLMRQGLSEGSDGVKAVVVPVAGHHGIA
jgi:hypothetical protein